MVDLENGIREDEAIIIGAVAGAMGVVQYKQLKIPIVNDNEIYSLAFYGVLIILGYFYDNLIGDAILGYGIGGVIGVIL